MLTKLEQSIFLIGYQFYVFQLLVGMKHLDEGVAYYAEVHTSLWNSCVHTLFMPITMFGLFLAVPAMFNLSPANAIYLRKLVMLFYLGLYMRISPLISVLFLAYYMIPFTYSDKFYEFIYNTDHTAYRAFSIVVGMTSAVLALFVQEVLGHYIGGDAPSRFEGIANAVLYAPYYSIYHMTTRLPYIIKLTKSP